MAESLADKLAAVPAFMALTDEERAEVARLGEMIKMKPAEVIYAEGDLEEGAYLVLAGQVELVINPDTDNRISVDRLHEGAFFAIDSMFEEETARHHAVMGNEGGIVQVVRRLDLEQFLAASPVINAKAQKAQQMHLVLEILGTAPSLASVPAQGMMSLAEDAELVSAPSGTKLIKQGESEDHLFIVKSGKLYVTRDEAPNHRIAILGPGDILGEMAVLKGEPRTASITADEPVEAYRISGEALRDVVRTHEELAANLDELMRVRVDELSRKEELRRERRAELERKEAERQERIAKSEEEARKRTETVEVKQAWWKRFTKPPAIRQHSEMDCSAACLCTVVKTYGKTISINVAREVARVRQDGASMANVIRAAKEFGFETEAYMSTVEQLREKELPAIVNWKGYHWIVVHEVKDDMIIAADPAQGLVDLTLKEFEENWSRYTIFMKPTARFEELQESPPTLRAFSKFFIPYKRIIFEVFAAAFFLQILNVMVPLFSKFVVDDVIMKGDEQWLTMALIVMAGVSIVNMLLSYVKDEMTLRLTMRCNLSLITHVYDRLLRLPMNFYENRRTGDVTSRLEQHEEITNFITEDGLETFLSLFTAVAYLFFMFYFDTLLTFAALFFMSFDFVIIRYISPKIRQINRETFVKEAEQESHLIESIRGAEALKTMGVDFMARWKYENHFAAVANMGFKEAKLGQIAGLLSGTLDSLGDIAVLFLGGTFVIQGKMTIGELIAFTVFTNGVQGPISSIIGKWDELQEALVAVERLNDILEKDPEFSSEYEQDEEKLHLPPVRGDIEFRGVSFRYEPDDQSNVVQNINLKIKAGQKIAFVGSSGCGKSTLLKLLYAFCPPSSGQILLDGFSTKEVSIPSLRRQIAMVPQESLIFKGTIRQNISLANEEATFEEIREAAELAGADEFIAKMPAGYESMVEEQGANLSGGQRQRLVIARAFLQQASILVMDEATSALDNETERVVMDHVKARFADKTVIMIAHRLSTIRHADLIVVLNNGLIAESGTHDELMDTKGLYYHLCARQVTVE